MLQALAHACAALSAFEFFFLRTVAWRTVVMQSTLARHQAQPHVRVNADFCDPRSFVNFLCNPKRHSHLQTPCQKALSQYERFTSHDMAIVQGLMYAVR
jgi:hypothetical protein